MKRRYAAPECGDIARTVLGLSNTLTLLSLGDGCSFFNA